MSVSPEIAIDNPHSDSVVLIEQVRYEYQGMPMALSAVAVVSLFLALFQWSVIDHAIIVSWLLLVYTITLGRVALYRAFKRTLLSSDNVALWAGFSSIGIGLSGASWGLTAILLFPDDNIVHQVTVVMVIGGMIAGATTTLTARWSSSLLYLLPAIIPLNIQFYSMDNDYGSYVGSAVALYTWMMVIISRRASITILNLINLRFSRRQAEAALLENASINRQILSSTAEGIFGTDRNGITTFVNPAAARMLGYDLAELKGRPIHQIIHHTRANGEHYHETACPMYQTLHKGVSLHSDDELLWRKDGTSFSADYLSNPIFQQGQLQGAVVSFRDITARKQTEERLHSSVEYNRALLEAIPDLMFLFDREGRVVDYHVYDPNDLFIPPERFLKRRIGEVLPAVHAERLMVDLEAALAGEMIPDREFSLEMPSGIRHYERRMVQCGQDKVITFIRNITDKREAEERIEYQAFFDELTALPNRTLLINRMEQVVARCQRHQRLGALLVVNIDRFKTINDALGHTIGDALLRQVGERIADGLRAEDTVAHHSGDEFIILLSDISDSDEDCHVHTSRYADKIQLELSRPYDIEGRQLHLTVSVGVALFPMSSDRPEIILREADIAIHRAKELGGDAIQFYLPSMQLAVDDRLRIENDLRKALNSDELYLHFQPQVNSLGEVTGAETLLRWNPVGRGQVSPADFIPVAEDTGLILPIGDWVMLNACRLLRRLQDKGLRKSLAVNVSPRQFRQRDFVEQVKATIDQTGCDPILLELEITEGIVVDNIEDTIEKMDALRVIGVRFAIDDFGTGYSSLNYLKRLPIDKLKIDQSFVRDLSSDLNDDAIVETIISMARHLDLEVIAEGVESQMVIDALQQKGCYQFQGFFFARPMGESDYAKLLSCGDLLGENGLD